ncbi:hypothetical protein RRU94_18580 [Domibacillus sp. DTU_2020_1001157_1_SI_ALB_TIR_016]|uniref:hypothetical protein n=1 Tax=Domibacillus sp. DTU_2020_1001157_1_SI_ALB_TIR_016 TaxID=3077789 RepID=UPI0028E7F927|nr:hypothetical protein [Domibacillus sp. DTU_2020_1001157_1_SI_ALB_TIR_016]WNS79535.1 hypothetical protein RRU94_18580 [Domibacillus sp. DTU_2020_1001157_1_SI_ALB_TIR_016]
MDKEALQFLSRLPDTFDLNESAKGEAFEKNEWTDVKTAAGKTYRLYETDGKVEGKNRTFYPVVVVYSEELAVKKQKALEKKWAKTHASLQKELDKKAKIA